MGALDFAGQRLYHAQATSTVNRETFVDFMERLIPQIAKPVPTFIILDNARIHHNLDESMTLANSGSNWTPIPAETGQRFRRKLDTDSG